MAVHVTDTQGMAIYVTETQGMTIYVTETQVLAVYVTETWRMVPCINNLFLVQNNKCYLLIAMTFTIT